MTKTVRIENGDSGVDHTVVVEIWQDTHDMSSNGDPTIVPKLINTVILGYPTQLLSETLWQGKFLIIREATKIKT